MCQWCFTFALPISCFAPFCPPPPFGVPCHLPLFVLVGSFHFTAIPSMFAAWFPVVLFFFTTVAVDEVNGGLHECYCVFCTMGQWDCFVG